MTASPARDQPETESLDPADSLVRRRLARDEVDYRAWCEVTYEMIQLGPETFHPADVLDALSPDAARRGRDEAALQVRADLEEIVCERFPAPIAVPFHAFVEGPRSPLARLHRLRDTWESLVRLLSAVALAESAACTPPMSRLVIRDSTGQAFRECKRRDFLSDKLAIRIGLIEGILNRAEELSIKLELASFLPADVLAEIRRLNAIRNGFSHESAKSDKQAEVIINETFPVLIEVLLDLRGLENIVLIRIKGIMPDTPPRAEIERLIGHAQSRRVRVVAMDKEMASIAMEASPVDEMDRVFASVGSRTLDLSPFIYAVDDNTGHRTRIAVFKCRADGAWCMEFVGDSVSLGRPADPHEGLLDRLHSLVVNRGGS